MPDTQTHTDQAASPSAEGAPTPGYEQYPMAFVTVTTELAGLRYATVGDDGEFVVLLGHPTREEFKAFLPAFLVKEGYDDDPDMFPDHEDADLTWARLLWSCPNHAPASKQEGCDFCRFIQPGYWWIDWVVDTTENLDANAGKRDYFPVTVWTAE